MQNKFDLRDKFYLNGDEIQIISGGIHYFRVVPEYWKDRLEKLKAMGCNTVETYVPWNLHEEEKGKFNFNGILDIKKFIETAGELGLWVIVRPSPYICAEWEFGGLPAWLLKEDGMRLRGLYEPFLDHVKSYYKELFQILTPLQINYGGPVIMMQVENEYGYYGDDTEYLKWMAQVMREEGTVVPLVTSDGPWGDALDCGKVEGVHPTANFGSKVAQQFEVLKKHTDGPFMCMEFWVGWFDNWGVDKHQTSDLEENKKDLEEIMKTGNVNIYMFEGGTNFGFMNGSNYYDVLTPDVTSYDYDAVLTESGKLTPKYEAFKEIIGRYKELPEVTFTTDIKEKEYGTVKLHSKTGLFANLNNLTEKQIGKYPVSMERAGQNYGYILYRSTLKKEKNLEKIRLYDANDRAQIFLNQEPLLTLYDRELLTESELSVEVTANSQLDILVENMGRVNFGPRLEKQRKGIDSGVQINGHLIFDWEMYTLPLKDIDKVDYEKEYEEGRPGFYRFFFEAEEAGDTYLDFTGWGKGCAFINGFNLGRYWEIGPQKRLYIPAPLIKKGKNEIVLFETEGKWKDEIHLSSEPDIG